VKKESCSPSQSPKEKDKKCSTPARRESASSSSSSVSSCGTKKESDADSHKSSKPKAEERRAAPAPAPVGSRRESSSEQDAERKRDKAFKEAVDKERKKDREAESQRRKERESIDSADKDRSNRHAERKEERRKKEEKRKDSTEHRSVERRKKDETDNIEEIQRFVKECDGHDEQKEEKKKESDRRHAERKEERRKEERRKESTEKRKDSTENRSVERRKKEEKRAMSVDEPEDAEDTDRHTLEKEQEAKKKEAERRKAAERLREQDRQKDADKEKQLKRHKEREERKKEADKVERRHTTESSLSRRRESEQNERQAESLDSKHQDEKRRETCESSYDMADSIPERKSQSSDVLDRRRDEAAVDTPLDRRREETARHHPEKEDNRRHQGDSQAERRHSSEKPKDKSADCLKDSLDRRKDAEENDQERRRERAASIGGKRRISSQDSVDTEEAKRVKVASDLVPERRDSKDSGRSSGSSKRSSNERYINSAEAKVDKTKKQRLPSESHPCKEDVDSEDDMKDMKMLSPEFGSNESLDDKGKCSKKDKHNHSDQGKKRKELARRRDNFLTGTDTDGSDDEDKPKKHSIFDIVDDGPAYISMYDKVKARSTKNMQKQEEEKRQEKMKEKFSALKQSRAKREEKKRSTSWDEDSDSESARGKSTRKTVITSSSEDDNKTSKSKAKKDETADSESDSRVKRVSVSDDGSVRNKSNRSKTGFATSEDERPPSNRHMNRNKGKAQIYSDDSEVDMGFAGSADEHAVSKSRPFQLKPIRDTTDEEADEPARRRVFQRVRDTTDEEAELAESSKRRVFLPVRDTTDEEGSIDVPSKMPHLLSDEDSSILTPSKMPHISSDEEELACDAMEAQLMNLMKHASAMNRATTSKHDQDENVVPNSTPPPPTLENSIHSKSKTDPFRKKSHKKKQKKKNSQDSPDYADKTDMSNSEKKAKKHSSKKERRKSSHSKSVEGDRDDEEKAKIRRKKMENNIKRTDDKMEDIFGPLSEDSENSKPAPPVKSNSRFDKAKWQVNDVYGSDDYYSDEICRQDLHLAKIRERKEKKRRERKALDEAGRVLEAKLVAADLASPPKSSSPTKTEVRPADIATSKSEPHKGDASKTDVQSSSDNTPTPTSVTTPSNDLDVFRFTEGDESRESEVAAVQDKAKEKRKKRKKSKEEKQNRHHHHHHHKDLFGDYDSRKQSTEENGVASKSEADKEKHEASLDEAIRSLRNEAHAEMPSKSSADPQMVEGKLSCPNSLEAPGYKALLAFSPKSEHKMPSPQVKSHEASDDSMKSPSRLLSPKRTPSPDRKHLEEPKPSLAASLSPATNKKVLIPGFGKEIDETIHETAVKSIELLEPSKADVVGSPQQTNIKPEPIIKTEAEEEKAIISQEETEDAVAALLEETFGLDFGGYGSENGGGGGEQADVGVSAPAALDDDCLKPDTPQSEPDLQIDTDTEDADRSMTPPAYDRRLTPESKSQDAPPPVSEGLEERICDIARSRSPPVLVKMGHADMDVPKIHEATAAKAEQKAPNLVASKLSSEGVEQKYDIDLPKLDAQRLDAAKANVTQKRDLPSLEAHVDSNKIVSTAPKADKSKLDMPSLEPKLDPGPPDLKHIAPSVIAKPEQRLVYQRPVIVSVAQEEKKSVFSAVANNLDKLEPKTSKEDVPKGPIIKGSVIPPMLVKQYVNTSMAPTIIKGTMVMPNAKVSSAPMPMPALTPTQPAALRGTILTQPMTQPMAPLIRANIVQARPMMPQQHQGVTSPTRPPKAVCFATASPTPTPKLVNSKPFRFVSQAPQLNLAPQSSLVSPSLVPVTTSSVAGAMPGKALPSSVVTSAENSITPVASISASATTPAEAVTAAAVSSSLYGSKDDRDRDTGFMSPKREDTSRDSDRDDDEGALCIVEDEIVKKEPSRTIRAKVDDDHLKLDSPIDTKDESDFWSANKVNIDSVIKKVEAICSNDEMEARKKDNSKPWMKKLEADKSPWMVKEDPRTWLSNFPGTTSEKEAAKTAKAWMASAPVACDAVPNKDWPEAKVPEKTDGAKPVKQDPDAEAEATDAERRTWLETKTLDQLNSAAIKEKENGPRWNLQSFAGGVSDEEDADKEPRPWADHCWPHKEAHKEPARKLKMESPSSAESVPLAIKHEPEVDDHRKTPPILSPQAHRSTPETEAKTPSDASKEEAELSEVADDTDADKTDDRADNRRSRRGSRRGARVDRGADRAGGVSTRRTRNQPEATPPSVTTRRSRAKGKSTAGGPFMR